MTLSFPLLDICVAMWLSSLKEVGSGYCGTSIKFPEKVQTLFLSLSFSLLLSMWKYWLSFPSNFWIKMIRVICSIWQNRELTGSRSLVTMEAIAYLGCYFRNLLLEKLEFYIIKSLIFGAFHIMQLKLL